MNLLLYYIKKNIVIFVQYYIIIGRSMILDVVSNYRRAIL